MVTTNMIYKGDSSILFRTPGYAGGVKPGDSVPVRVDIYNDEFKEDKRWELEITEKKSQKKVDEK